MSSARLRTDLFVAAHIRRCQALGLDAFLRHRGEGESGNLLLKLFRFEQGAMLLEPSRSITGARVWMRITGPAPVADARVEEMIRKRLTSDPDLWVLEVEDRQGVHLLDEPVI